MKTLIDMNNPDDPDRVSQHRLAQLKALFSTAFSIETCKKYFARKWQDITIRCPFAFDL